MKKIISLQLMLVLMLLCGCTENRENTDTKFMLDTVVSLTADCDDETLKKAFDLCEGYEKLFSPSVEDSDVYRLNSHNTPVTVSDETVSVVERALYYGELSSGKFDITIYPVSRLWNFNDQIIPDRKEIAAALRNVDYHSISVGKSTVDLNGRQIDLGGIAKGYIADRTVELFKEENVPYGIVNLGGNVKVFGERQTLIGIRKPFSENELSAEIMLKNKSIVTSGVYERYIKTENGEFYHHILDPETGFGVDTDLYSASVVCDSALDADALATVCILMGKAKASKLIENIPDTEAVFIDNKHKISYTSGIKDTGDYLILK
ncbi:MAG: FAD:protein FMN transferase [Clostridia bacterium]|nr:FAD:protein FMN transferase [Clostridia bacterium]